MPADNPAPARGTGLPGRRPVLIPALKEGYISNTLSTVLPGIADAGDCAINDA